MPLLFWDASALAKRYVREIGTDAINTIFAAVPATSMATTVWGYAETFAILLRNMNGGRLDKPTFTTVAAALRHEVIGSPDFGFLNVDDVAVLASLPLIQRHNLNSMDATLLSVLLRHAQAQPPDAPRYVVVSADRRLLRAAEEEGFTTINPESTPAADVPALLAHP